MRQHSEVSRTASKNGVEQFGISGFCDFFEVPLVVHYLEQENVVSEQANWPYPPVWMWPPRWTSVHCPWGTNSLCFVRYVLNAPSLQLTLVRKKVLPSFSKMVWSSGPLKVFFKSSWMLGADVEEAPLYRWPPVLIDTAIFWDLAYLSASTISFLFWGWIINPGFMLGSTSWLDKAYWYLLF